MLFVTCNSSCPAKDYSNHVFKSLGTTIIIETIEWSAKAIFLKFGWLQFLLKPSFFYTTCYSPTLKYFFYFLTLKYFEILKRYFRNLRESTWWQIRLYRWHRSRLCAEVQIQVKWKKSLSVSRKLGTVINLCFVLLLN